MDGIMAYSVDNIDVISTSIKLNIITQHRSDILSTEVFWILGSSWKQAAARELKKLNSMFQAILSFS